MGLWLLHKLFATIFQTLKILSHTLSEKFDEKKFFPDNLPKIQKLTVIGHNKNYAYYGTFRRILSFYK